VTPEARGHLEKARQSLANTWTILSVNLGEEAGRAAYIAAFHAALAFIFERAGAGPKTHAGVHSHFGKLAKDDPHFDIALRQFLWQAYELKTAADYDLETDRAGSCDRAKAAVETAAPFIDCSVEAITEPNVP
jgi:uncharacterized protein (UPF0332 family)